LNDKQLLVQFMRAKLNDAVAKNTETERELEVSSIHFFCLSLNSYILYYIVLGIEKGEQRSCRIAQKVV